MSPTLASSEDILREVSAKAKTSRLSAAMTQAELAVRAGINLASLRRFERTGQASFELVVRVAMALRAENGFAGLFDPPRFASLDEAMEQTKTRKRGRRGTRGGPG